ncbi:Fur-regulated basic protein A [Salinibacillus kushneri]|uniref:Fur-regulated basic protein A n=1 Tax=Salinibacillus kushneri TaxID=237682 RepID=A0A1I0DQB4_9BACI|nr:Fur-regulated basic protein A [Salinibacillus kushneri]
MKEQTLVKLAGEIIELDVKRDELFEQLMSQIGTEAYGFLRLIQNHYIPGGGVSEVKNQLREAVEMLKEHYIQQLIKAGIYNPEDKEVYSLTLTELHQLVEKYSVQ